MCTLMAGIMMAGTALSAYGQYQQGNAAKKAANYNAAVSEENARAATENANDTLVRGRDEENKVRRRTSAIKGQQTASMAANGVDINWGGGSAQDVMADTVMLGELDALTSRKNSEREANSYYTQAASQQNQGTLYRQQAKSSSSWLGAAGTVLTGAGNAYKAWSG